MGAEGAWSERGRGLNGKAHWLAVEGAWLNRAGPIGWLLRGRGLRGGRGLNGKGHWLAVEGVWLNRPGLIGWR